MGLGVSGGLLHYSGNGGKLRQAPAAGMASEESRSGLLRWALMARRVQLRWQPGSQEGGAGEAFIQVCRLGSGGTCFLLSGFNLPTPLSCLQHPT